MFITFPVSLQEIYPKNYLDFLCFRSNAIEIKPHKKTNKIPFFKN